MGKQKFRSLESTYESYRWQDGQLPATYEVVYGHAWKKHEAPKSDYHTYKVDIQKPSE